MEGTVKIVRHVVLDLFENSFVKFEDGLGHTSVGREEDVDVARDGRTLMI